MNVAPRYFISTHRSLIARCLLALFAMLLVLAGPVQAAPAGKVSASYIVILKGGHPVAQELTQYGLTATQVYSSVFPGYAAVLSDAQRKAITSDADVEMVVADETIAAAKAPIPPVTDPTQPAQVVPTGVRRIGGLLSPTARINGIDQRVDADIAVIDSGVDLSHPDINIAGGVDCTSGDKYGDPAGHGTHVAGIAAALDNRFGVVGVAPGARIWAVRVLNKNGGGSKSHIICGIDWVTAHADVIDVANLSFGTKGSDDGRCGEKDNDAMHIAICRSVAAGVTYVSSAGNASVDTRTQVPAAYGEVISVSAISDYDGLSGSLADPSCFDMGADDSFATYSNFGSVVDLAAPGSCIFSTWIGRYGTNTGTSMSAPHVSGAAALYLSNHPDATPAQVRTTLMAAASPGPIAGDPDNSAEGILNVSTL